MKSIGVPREIKDHESRVSLKPVDVKELVELGYEIFVEESAGIKSGYLDDEYISSGATILEKREVFHRSDLIVKVKEPLLDDFKYMKEGQCLFTYLHLAANRECLENLLKLKIRAFAYETLSDKGTLPLLNPMSEIAGNVAAINGIYHLSSLSSQNGNLPTGSLGVLPPKAMVIGAGASGLTATKFLYNIGMDVVVLDLDIDKLKRAKDLMPNIKTLYSSKGNISTILPDVDLIIGAVLTPGARAPLVIDEDMLKLAKKNIVIADIAIDQGGCIYGAKPTTHSEPTYIFNDRLYYCVTNMPAMYGRTATNALTNATFPYLKLMLEMSEDQLFTHPVISSSLNTLNGEVKNNAVLNSLI